MLSADVRRRLRLTSIAATAAIAVSGAAAPGASQAHHVGGATYSGEIDGGRIELDVSAEDTVTRFKLYTRESGRLSECYEGLGLGIPIEDHTFDGVAGPAETVNGSFPSPRSAEGTFTHGPRADGSRLACLAFGTYAWTAKVDRTGPVMRLGGKARQSSGRPSVAVTVECPREACSAAARGRLQVVGAGATKRFRLGAADADVSTGVESTLRLRILPKARRAIRRALRVGGTATARVTVTARDNAGNAASKKRTIRLASVESATSSRVSADSAARPWMGRPRLRSPRERRSPVATGESPPLCRTFGQCPREDSNLRPAA
jgi:hypothetical protein